MPNPELYQITLPSGVTYDLKDAQARSDIADIRAAMAGGVNFIGVTSTELSDGATTNPITIGGSSVTAKKGDIVTYGSAEFIWNGTAWQAFGDLSGLGDLAFKDSASGTVAVPKTYTTTVTPTTTTKHSNANDHNKVRCWEHDGRWVCIKGHGHSQQGNERNSDLHTGGQRYSDADHDHKVRCVKYNRRWVCYSRYGGKFHGNGSKRSPDTWMDG